MKKVILIIAIALTPLFSNAQSSVFDKYDGEEDVTTVVVSKKMFELMGKFGGGSDEAAEYIDMVGGLDGLKVFTTENSDIASDMQSTVDKYLKSSKLSELMRINDKDANVRIYIKEGRDDDHVKELLMFVNGIEKHVEGMNGRSAEAVIVSLTGDIDLNKIAELTEGMNISGSEHLKDVKKENK
ncbi:DUF4252 domain-containing protein [Urechidicola vernalis]|uniref:DUF4252 domain-containing protein n=1 Tax=Urechidicola vernalis TaxID=3075600 RepID=A0ABU2Y1L7_9FLAO|nr:DUF4252 domain-containing protein [Urechidicola sp. P050]MDT0551907.1 DUF4252 domain-containing protein [Urechidicola sp. P050]